VVAMPPLNERRRRRRRRGSHGRRSPRKQSLRGERRLRDAPRLTESEEDRVLEQYSEPGAPGALGGVQTFAKEIKLPTDRVEYALSALPAFTLHRPIRRRFKRGRIFVANMGDQMEFDLAEFQSVKDSNRGYSYLLVGIDSFSKMVYAVPLRTKSGGEVAAGIETVFRRIKARGPEFHVPYVVVTDQGLEFRAKETQAVFKKHDVVHRMSTDKSVKASMVERCIGTLKRKIYRHFTLRNTYDWISVIDSIVDNYNNTVHSSIKTKPALVTDHSVSRVFDNLYGDKSRLGELVHNEQEQPRFKFKVGDFVRINVETAEVGYKGYLPHFSVEIFIVDRVIPRNPPVYLLKDQLGESVSGIFYAPELVRVTKYDPATEEFRVERVVARRTRNRKRELLVKFYGYPDKFNQWLPEEDVTVDPIARQQQAAADLRVRERKRGRR
jgi:hypothetical protein